MNQGSFLLALLLSTGLLTACSKQTDNTIEQNVTSYKNWQPAITAKEVYKDFIIFNDLMSFDDALYWIEIRPDEQGRYVLVKKDKAGSLVDVTAKNYSVRSRVYEYGGPAFTVKDNYLFFVNFSDQRIYRQDLTNPTKEAIPITVTNNADGSTGKYMNLSVSKNGEWLLFVYEKEYQDKENLNYIATINLKNKKVSEPVILAEGADFYDKPSFSNSNQQIAWVQWNHPYMPWDSSQLYVADFQSGKLNKKKKIAGDDKVTIGDFVFDQTDELFFTMDFPEKSENSPQNYYNIYHYKNGLISEVTKSISEYHQLLPIPKGIAAIQRQHGYNKLYLVDSKSGATHLVNGDFSEYNALTVNNRGDIFAITESSNAPPQIINLSSGETIKKAFQVTIDASNISQPRQIKFPTSDGDFSYGYFYQPANQNYVPPNNEKPPARILLHGGPTSRTSISFDLSTMFWTSQGYAVFDVDYRGSTGYGRQYRDKLLNSWGIKDTKDVNYGITYLKKNRLISDKIFVSGGSAGGYAVQRLLTYYPNLFNGGASYYGIGNLVTLQNSTHKYESSYLVQLIGGTMDAILPEYMARSPINNLDQLNSPMIIFQGSEDKIVPPENSREMANILKEKRIYHEYYEYKGESHGFRKKSTMVETLEKEAVFFKKLL